MLEVGRMLYPNRALMARKLAIGVGLTVFAACMAARVRGHESPRLTAGNWMLLAVFFGIMSFAVSVTLLPNAYYFQFTAEGLTTCSAYRKRFYRWSELARFGVFRMPGRYGSRERIGFSFKRTDSRPPIGRRFRLFWTGYEKTLPNLTTLRANELVDLMNEYRQRFGGA